MSAPTSTATRLAPFVPGCTALSAALVIALVFSPTRAVPVAVVGMLALALAALGVDIAGPVQRAAAALGRWLFATIIGLLYMLVFVPAWVVRRVTGRNDLHARSRRAHASETTASTWTGRSDVPSSAFAAGSVPGDRRSLVGRLAWGVGCVVLLLTTNYGIGWAWDRATNSSGPDSFIEAIDPSTTAGTVYDPRVTSPALADTPWAKEYLADLQRTQFSYWPYTELRPLDFHSPHINIENWRRSTLAPTATDEPMPTVWLLGGSAMFGEGQRDEHTIASELVRIAESHGVPITAANYGQRGWVHFQEMVLYEQELAQNPVPDIALFYDGPNDINTQALVPKPVPSHYQAKLYAEKLTGSHITTQVIDPAAGDPTVWDVWHAYSRHSAIHKAMAWLRARPAGAEASSPAQRDEKADDQDANGQFVTHPTAQDGTDAGRVYERVKQLTLELSRKYGVDVLLFWQPLAGQGPADKTARKEITDPTIDVSQALVDHPEVFLDGVHTNELGARIMAEVLWEHLGPKVHRWYADHG